MRRLITVAAVVVLALLVLLPALGVRTGGSAANDASATITSYDAVFRLAADGDLAVRESLAVSFPDAGSHTLHRFFDRYDQSAPRALRTPHDIAVTVDGRPERVSLSHQDDGRYVVAGIPVPGVTTGGTTHTVVIRYAVAGVVEPGTGAEASRFHWSLVPTGWQLPIQDVHLVVRLPVAPPAAAVQCGVGSGDQVRPCAVGGLGTTRLTVDGSGLAPDVPVTIQAGLPMATPPPGESLPWPATWEPVLGDSYGGLVGVVVLALLAAGCGVLVSGMPRVRKPAFPPQDAPPPGVGPAEAAYLMTERIDQHDFVAALLWAAEQGAVELSRRDDGWRITDTAGPDAWATHDRATAVAAPLLGGVGGSFAVARRDAGAGRVLQSRLAALVPEARAWARAHRLVARTRLGGPGGTLVIVAALATVLTAYSRVFGTSLAAVVPGAFAIAALPLLLPTSALVHTRKGRDLWSRLGGFERTLSTPSSRQRFGFAGRQELYAAYLPWAVAFGCADVWAKKYRTEVGTEPPVPAYLGGYAGAHTGDHVSSMVHDLTTTVASAASDARATRR